MTLEVTAELARSLFYNGRVIINDQKLDKKDFQQMVYGALGDMGRIEWYQEAQRGNQDFYWGKCITTDTFKVEKQKRKLIINLDDRGVLTLPRASGVVRVYPAGEDGDNWDDDLQKISPGAQTFYASPKQRDDLGLKLYIPLGDSLEVWGVNEGDKIDVDYIPNDINLEIPDGLAWAIIKDITGVVAADQSRPVDNTEDGDPNTVTQKGRLADPSGI